MDGLQEAFDWQANGKSGTASAVARLSLQDIASMVRAKIVAPAAARVPFPPLSRPPSSSLLWKRIAGRLPAPQDVGALGQNSRLAATANGAPGAARSAGSPPQSQRHVPRGSVHAHTAPPGSVHPPDTPGLTPVHPVHMRSLQADTLDPDASFASNAGRKELSLARERTTLEINSENVLRGEMTLQRLQASCRAAPSGAAPGARRWALARAPPACRFSRRWGSCARRSSSWTVRAAA